MRGEDRGQLGPLGVILILAIIVIGIVAMVTIGADAIRESKRVSELDRAETALLQLDTRASLVALGDSNVQSLPLGATGSGQWDVDENAGSVTIIHHNYVNGSDEPIIYQRPLGALEYHNGDSTVAYQGGGVWRSDDGVSSEMVAPPEFHFRKETLVFPLVHVEGTGQMTGSRSAVITGDDDFERIFPNPAQLYGDGNRSYTNPIRGGSVSVRIQSDYYQAWARFFRERLGGDIALDDANRSVTVDLTAPRFIGDFDMPNEGSAIEIEGITGGHALETFTIDLAPPNDDAARFNNLQWSMYIDEAGNEFEVHLKLRKEDDNSTTLCKEQLIEATVYYSDTSGNTYQGWHNPNAFRTTCTDGPDADDLANNPHLEVNLTGPTPMYLSELSANNLEYLDAKGTRETNITFDQHQNSVEWEPVTYAEDGTNAAPIGRLLKHYFGLFGSDYDIIVVDQNSDSVNEEESTGYLQYASKGHVTYMHLTTDSIRIDLQ